MTAFDHTLVVDGGDLLDVPLLSLDVAHYACAVLDNQQNPPAHSVERAMAYYTVGVLQARKPDGAGLSQAEAALRRCWNLLRIAASPATRPHRCRGRRGSLPTTAPGFQSVGGGPANDNGRLKRLKMATLVLLVSVLNQLGNQNQARIFSDKLAKLKDQALI